METKPPMKYDVVEFQKGDEFVTHSMVGIIKYDACLSKCTVENIPHQLFKGDAVNLLLTTRDSKGNPTIPCQEVKVKMKMLNDATWEDIDFSNNYNGTSSVQIFGNREGKLLVSTTIGSEQIPGSPFEIAVISGLVQTVGKQEGRLRLPWGLTVNKHGDFVTANGGANSVSIHDRDGHYKQSFTFTGQFVKPFRPCDIAISDDKMFMLDDNNRHVVVSEDNGKFIRCFGSVEIDCPCGIAINPVTKHVYVSEKNKDCIRKYTHSGRYINSFGRRGTKQGQFRKPFYLACNSKGVVYVADRDNDRIQVFGSMDQFLFEFSSTGNSRISHPRGVAIDKNDYVYVSSEHKVVKYDTYGQFICRIDSDKDGLSYPFGVVVCNDGRIAVVENGNNCIKVFVE
uniref:E3 ubiquitin-protein ligase TRIM71-like n=1 Tax=Saccoglossus kowalevskii TaxID=10224 RepID=A0ABM0MT95_SACKO|nr:PREDICTED: E3 ubiquitin-protein ligase TRIM71-like [Saccoglossus kowalevskii]